ncbi:hypothetical protein BpHYR1_006787 [Brachionus plicatilis]|uniref:Uncharacterized protein n=1 Tax=Brachionus plicatilis TaxID=10195 RepID=A0A3M7S9I5_BRAPC|nr:hypothetical protein BpHYR1_006787 [Brachionus plicatilis]
MRSRNKLIVAIYDKHCLKLKIINLILTFCDILILPFHVVIKVAIFISKKKTSNQVKRLFLKNL